MEIVYSLHYRVTFCHSRYKPLGCIPFVFSFPISKLDEDLTVSGSGWSQPLSSALTKLAQLLAVSICHAFVLSGSWLSSFFTGHLSCFLFICWSSSRFDLLLENLPSILLSALLSSGWHQLVEGKDHFICCFLYLEYSNFFILLRYNWDVSVNKSLKKLYM